MSKRVKIGNPKTAIGYLRVSTEKQELGPKAQMKDLEGWAERAGVEILAVFFDHGISGEAPIVDRPGLVAAFDAVRAHGAGVLVASKRDRLARDVVVAATIERVANAAGAKIVSADGTGNGDTPADAFMRTVVDGAAAYERALIKMRTTAALAVKKGRGERLGHVPYGFHAPDGVHLAPLQAEQAILATVRELRASGASTYGIARELGTRGVTSRTGKPFIQTQIVRMLARAAA